MCHKHILLDSHRFGPSRPSSRPTAINLQRNANICHYLRQVQTNQGEESAPAGPDTNIYAVVKRENYIRQTLNGGELKMWLHCRVIIYETDISGIGVARSDKVCVTLWSFCG